MIPSGDRADASRDDVLDRVYRRGRVLRRRRHARRAATVSAAVIAVVIPLTLSSGSSPDQSKVKVVSPTPTTAVAPSTTTTSATATTTTIPATTTSRPATATTVAPSVTTTTIDAGDHGAPPPNQPLTLTLRYQPLQPSSGQVVWFKSTADDPDASIQCIAVDFGDGTSTGAPCAPPLCDTNPTWGPVAGHKDRVDQHTFGAPGTYTVRATAYSGPCQSQFASTGETSIVVTVQ